MRNVLIAVGVSALVVIAMVEWAYFRILRIAKIKKLTDNPNSRKLQQEPIPVMGGIVIFLGIVTGVFTASAMHACLGMELSAVFLPVLMALAMMLYIGAMDDIIGLSPTSRFVIEILAVLGIVYSSGYCIDSFHGLWGIGSFSWLYAVPLTIFACVGIINAMNMIDGVNGLSSGLSIIYCCLFGDVFIRTGDLSNAVLAFSMVAALLPFFVHNVFGLRSRMFLGDAGTMILGMLMSWFTVCLVSSGHSELYPRTDSDLNVVAFTLAVLSLPVFDTLRVMTMRMVHKRSPFHSDKTHLHHAFVSAGISHSITALSEIILNLLVVTVWYISANCFHASCDAQLYAVIAAAVVLVWGTYVILYLNAKSHSNFFHRLAKFGIKTHLGRTSWWKKITAVLDAPEDRLIAEIAARKEEARPASADRFLNIDTSDVWEVDRKAIFNYSRNYAEVYVIDIRKNSGANPKNVYSIISEEIEAGYMRIIREDENGLPDIVAVIEKK